MNEIWRGGYEAASVKALSERLGITRSSFYNAFGSREALFRAILERYAAQSPDRVIPEADGTISVRRLITSVVREVCHLRAVDPEGRGCLIVNTIGELSAGEGQPGHWLVGMLRQRIGQIEALLEAAIQSGELPETTDPKALASAVQMLLIGLNTMSKAERDEAALWSAARLSLIGLGLYDDAIT